MNIVTALEEFAVDGVDGDHDYVIETVLSKLFVRGDEVLKAYKHRTADFADLADKEIRRKYISEDFFWNNIMAPDIYLELRHVQNEDGRFIHVVPEEAEDWYIVMRKIDVEHDLLRTLEKRAPTEWELSNYARVLTERLSMLTLEKAAELQVHIDRGAVHLKDEVLGVCAWAYTAEPFLSKGEVDRAKILLQSALDTEAYFANPNELSVVIDSNPENIILMEDRVSFIDVMPPKDLWRVHDRYFPLCRTSADIAALSGIAEANLLHKFYQKENVLPPPLVRMTYELAAALIQVPYRKMVGRTDLAQKYADFVRRRMDDLEGKLAKMEIE